MADTGGENWKPVAGWEGYYMVSDLGRVKSLPRITTRKNGYSYQVHEKILTPNLNIRGYFTVALRRPGKNKTAYVHRLVTDAFIGPMPIGMETLHGLGGRLDNRLVNLRYGTHSENEADKLRYGVQPCRNAHLKPPRYIVRGENHHCSRLTESDILFIKEAKGAMTGKQLAERFGITVHYVYQIQAGRRRAWSVHQLNPKEVA